MSARAAVRSRNMRDAGLSPDLVDHRTARRRYGLDAAQPLDHLLSA